MRLQALRISSFFTTAPRYPMGRDLYGPRAGTPAGQPDHQAIYHDAIHEYQFHATRQTEIERLSTEKEKTGVLRAPMPSTVNGARIPIWVADYVMMGYGTGAIMAVPPRRARLCLCYQVWLARDPGDRPYRRRRKSPFSRVRTGGFRAQLQEAGFDFFAAPVATSARDST